MRAAALGRVRARLLLPDRAVGGLVEPRPLRRGALRPASDGEGGLFEIAEDARRRLRRRAEAADHARHVRALGRLLRRVLRTGAEGADADRARARGAVRAFDLLVSPTSPTVAFPLGARRRTRSRCTSRTSSRSPPTWPACPGCRSRAACRRACRSASSWSGPQFSENALFRAGHALEQALDFDYVPERLR